MSYKVHAGFATTNVQFSPWDPNCMAVSAAENFGVVGKGSIYILRTSPNGDQLSCDLICPVDDACYDICYLESAQGTVLAATGDGIKVIQTGHSSRISYTTRFVQPTMHLIEHRREVVSIQCSPIAKNMVASASNDCSFKIWDIEHHRSVATCHAHSKELYEASWSPFSPFHLGTCSGDCTMKFWDTRQVSSMSQSSAPAMAAASKGPVLSMDWNKYSNMVASSCADKSISIWDIRRLDTELCSLHGHVAAVRKLRFSPFSKNFLFSGGYDFCCCLWDINKIATKGNDCNPLVHRYHHHTEFVIGLDWNLFHKNLVASCGFDGFVYTWPLGGQPQRTASTVAPYPTNYQVSRKTPKMR